MNISSQPDALLGDTYKVSPSNRLWMAVLAVPTTVKAAFTLLAANI